MASATVLMAWAQSATRYRRRGQEHLFHLVSPSPSSRDRIVAATLLGRLLWPAAIAGLVSILLGIGVLYGVRLSPPERRT
jgi:hypothetical protein